MLTNRLDIFVPALLLMLLSAAPVVAQNEGLVDLDEATQLKATAQLEDSSEGMADITKVIDLVDTALEKGLDEENTKFAEQLLISSLIQRAKVFSRAILSGAVPVSPRDNRWMQIRQFALTDLQRAVMMDKDQWEAHLLIGQLHLLGERNVAANAFAADAARRAFTAVINAKNVPDKELAEALAMRAVIQKDAEKRLQDLNRAVELQAHDPKYLLLRAKHNVAAEQLDEALADVDRAIELDPESADSHELRGRVLLGQEKFEEAMESFHRFGELTPDSVIPYQRLGEAFIQQGELDKAIEQLTKALDMKPDDAATLLIRGSVHFQAGDVDAALADIDRVLELNPGLVKAYELKSDMLASEERFDEAIKELTRVLNAAPDRPELISMQYRVANYYLLNEQPEPAIDAFGKVLRWDPDNVDALRGRGDAYLNMGKHAEAITDLSAALEGAPDDDGLLNNLAWLLATSPFEEHRDGKRAIELATKACELTAYEAPHILSTLAAAYAESGDFESAIKYSTQAVEKGQNDASLPQLNEELASYKAGKPWRELQQMGADAADIPDTQDQPDESDHTFAPPSAPRAPARTSDF